MSLDAPVLKNNIRQSETEQTLKDQVESQLKLAEYILRGAEDKYGKGSDIYEKIKNEQNELKQSIQTTLDDNNETTQDEMLKLKLELGDILQIADTHDIHEKKGILSNKWWDKVTGVNRTEAEEKSDELLNKNIEDYTEEEAKIILEHLNNEFLDYKEGFFSGSNENSLSELKGMTQKDIESYQERLIDIILGNEDGYNNGKLKAFSKEKGYYIINQQDIEVALLLSLNQYDLPTKINYIKTISDKFKGNTNKIQNEFIQNYGKEKANILLQIGVDNDIFQEANEQNIEVQEILKEVNNILGEIKNTKLEGDNLSVSAYKDEVIKQKNEFYKKLQEYNNGKITLEELIIEKEHISILNTTNVISAVAEGLSHYFDFDIFGAEEENINDMRTKLTEMNLVYLAAKANDVFGTDKFKKARDEVSKKIIELEKKDNPNLKSDISTAIGHITYNPTEISNKIIDNQYENIDKYELYFYIKNEHGNFSDKTVQQLLTKYPRDFIIYISGKFLEDGGILSTLVDKKKDFLTELKSIDKVLNLNNVNDLNLATDEFSGTEVENAKNELLNPQTRKKFIEKLKNSSSNELNEVMYQLRLFAIKQTLIENKSKFIRKIETENGVEESDILFTKSMEIAEKIAKDGLYGDDLVLFIIKELNNDPVISSTCKLGKSDFNLLLKSFNKADKLTIGTWKEAELDSDSSISGEVKDRYKELSSIQEQSEKVINKRIESINILSEEDFNNLTQMIEDGGSFDEIDKYFSEHNEEYKLLQEKHNNIENTVNINENINIQKLLQEDKRININNGQPEIITQQGNNAPLSQNDLLSIQQNPDNLENIINCCNLMNDTGFGNLWDGKDQVFKSISNSIGIGFNLDGDYLNINEMRIMFNTILKSLGYPEINGLADENSIRNYLKNINGIQIGGETKDANKAGDSKLEDEFFKKFFPKNSTFGFKSSKFEQAIA